MMIPPLWFNAVGPGRCVIDFTILFSAAKKAGMPFFPFLVFFVGATSLWCYHRHSSNASNCFKYAA
jgi:hypothetical protein